MNRLIATALLCTLPLLLPLPALAAYTGPQDVPQIFTTVVEAREFPIDDHGVKFEGHIVKRVGHDKYLFRDKTGAIRLEIDADVIPAQDFDDTTAVRITGEIDSKTLDTPQIDVDHIEILK